jgi:flagellar hook protein FlgE
MISSIFIAQSGLRGYEQGLRVIANNTANLNTPGFKSSRLQFADLYNSTGSWNGGIAQGYGQPGYGLSALGTMLELHQGQLQNTGNSLDLAVDGLGMFVLRDEAGRIHYTRDGQFMFDADGKLVSVTTGEEVLARDGDRNLSAITIAVLSTNPPAATANIVFRGNLSSTVTTRTVGNVTVIDRVGTSHTLSVRFDAVAGMPGTWDVAVMDGATTIGTGRTGFVNGQIDPAQSRVSFTYTVVGQGDMPLTLDLTTNVTSFDSGSQSTLAMASQDGHAQGSLTSATFDADGVLQLSYSNGQTVEGAQLALARFNSQESIQQVGNNEFEAKDGRPWEMGVAQEDGFGTVRSGVVEVSNVDLSREFTDLVIMQRGYQASSQVISVANEMLVELFDMRGK